VSTTDSAGFVPLISRSQVHEEFRNALRLFIGRGKRYSYKQAGNGAGISPRMIECFLAPVGSQEWRDPHVEHILSLASFLGPDFTSELLRPTAQGAYHLPEEEPDPGALVVENSEDNAEITRRGIDGKFCNEDRAVLPEVGIRMVNRGMKLVAIGGKRA
jgi:hypothetical protein